ncbi:MAG: ABC transporter ATP-binding protein [Bacillota bacterium]|nr:ABC transporter ATP-binding protein [Bacillota bacterium]
MERFLTAPGAPAATDETLASDLMSIRDLKVGFRVYGGTVQAVDLHYLSLGAGEVLALVGETGCGKSVTARAILRLLPPGKAVVSGSILFRGEDLLQKGEREMDRMRGKEISMVFQDPMSAFNPVFPVGDVMVRAIRLHQGLGAREARERAVEMFRLVRLPRPEATLRLYPHELSGGMRQRVMIAMALSCRPSLLIADEPTTALDVTIQAQILRLLVELRQQVRAAVIFITHNLGVVAEIAERVAVMYAGDVVEWGPVEDIFCHPTHPYTCLLLAAIPRRGGRGRLKVIGGEVPNALRLPPGCRFAPRCPRAQEVCGRERPLLMIRGSRAVACHFPGEGAP